MKNKIMFMLLLMVTALRLSALEDIRVAGNMSQEGKPLQGILKITVGKDQMVLADERSLKTYYAALDQKGDFSIQLAVPTKLVYVSFLLHDTAGKVIQKKNIDLFEQFFLMENGDDVKIRVDFGWEISSFTGKGGVSLKCQYNLLSAKISSLLSMRISRLPLDKALEEEDEIRKKHLASGLSLLETYKEEIGREVFVRLSSDLIARQKNQFMYGQFASYSIEKPARRAIRASYFIANYDSSGSFFSKNPDARLSPWYTEYLFNRERLISIFKSADFNKGDMQEIYKSIVQNYIGDDRDRLLLTFFMSTAKRNFANLEPLMNDAVHNLKNKEVKDAFQSFVKDNSTGKAVVNFSYVDETGKIHRLSDFKDKILVLDFWFTGCHGCREIPAVLKPIIEQFRTKKEVVFLSINIDKSRSSWDLGLKSGEYTLKGQLHLNTGGRGADDDFIKAYNIKSYPRLFVVGKHGRLLASNPVDPRIDQGKDIVEHIVKSLE